MKTSSKLLIAFFILMPLLMVVFDLLLKDQFVKGNITRRRPDSAKAAIIHELKPFKYVVYNGKLVYRKGGREKAIANNERLGIAVGEGGGYRIGIDQRRKDMLEYSYRADTLFISYNVKDLDDSDFFYWSGKTVLYAPELNGITVGDGTINLWPCRQKKRLNITVLPFGNVSGSYMHLPHVNLSVAGGSKAELQRAEIDTLAYDLMQGSELAIKYSYQIKTLKPGMVDSTSIISISGSAAKMEQVIVPSGKAPNIVTKQ